MERGGLAKYRFVVTDNGCGMSEEFLTHIFEPFERNEASVTNKIQGTGLGMPITKSLVDAMHGEIRVKSEIGKGTCFVVELPFKQITAKQEEAEIPSAEEALREKRFLCAEDNALNSEILEEMLKVYGAECKICSDGEQLVETFQNAAPGTYDAILTDVQMPNMNGLEATRAIRASGHPQSKTIPIIAMTASAFAEDVQRSLDAGMNAHVPKPINAVVLMQTVRNLCETAGTADAHEEDSTEA